MGRLCLEADVEAGDVAKLEDEGKCGKEEAEDLGSAGGDNVEEDDEDNDFDEDTVWSHNEEGKVQLYPEQKWGGEPRAYEKGDQRTGIKET